MEFKEYLIQRKKSITEIFLTVLLYIAALVLAFVFMFLIPPLAGLNLLLAVGSFYGAYKLSTKFNREYEYILTKDTIDIDVIFNASSRKRLISFDIKDVEFIAPANGSNISDKKNYNRVIDATTNRKNADVYFAVVEKEGRTLVKFEPPYTMLEILKKLEPRKVIINEN